MSQNQAAMQVTAPMLERHYKEVLSFQERRARAARFLSTGLVVAFWVSMFANVGLVFTVAGMMPLHRLVPLYFVIRQDGTIDSAPALSMLPPSTDQAIVRAGLWQYVQMREGFSVDTAQYRYDIVSGMSDPNTRTIYQQFFLPQNPQSPQNVVGKNGIVTVQPISVALIGPNVAQVRYQRTLVLGTSAPVISTWTATLQFMQVDTLPASQRLTNPGGMIITNYQNEEDTVQ
jgi:type IV secretion system protein VirB8